MSFTIPVWALWAFGIIAIPVLGVLVSLAWLGYSFIKAFSKGIWR